MSAQPAIHSYIRDNARFELHEPGFGFVTAQLAGHKVIKAEARQGDIHSAIPRCVAALAFALTADQSGEH